MANVKAKKRTFNIIMVIAALVIVVAGVMLVLNFKGGGATSGSSADLPAITTCEKSGNANIVRSGLGYALDNDATLQSGDQLETLTKSSISLSQDGVVGLRMGSRTTVVLGDADGAYTATLQEGSAIAWAKMPLKLLLCGGEASLEASDDALLMLTQEEGAASVTVLNGSVALSGVDAKAQAGEVITLLKPESTWNATTSTFDKQSLSDDSISALQSFIAAGATCVVSADDLTQLVADREAERTAAQQEAVNSSSISTTDGGSGSSSGSGSGSGSGSSSQPTCTIEIRCDTILNNMGDLTPGKEAYVPSNGTILATSTVAFNEGDTAFDVLVSACRAANIQLEYTFSSLYGSNYIEGINNLYEFDCGEESGWMYKVNGWFPNYGCSNYEMSDGDVMVWCYTCKGLGADVGGSVN